MSALFSFQEDAKKGISQLANTVVPGDCVEAMKGFESESIDFVLTDPPYLVRYRSRDGRTVLNDDRESWLEPAFRGIARVMKADTFCVSFYAWSKADVFLAAWRSCGLRPVGHIVFPKRYASANRFLAYHHEQAYLLAKGNPEVPRSPIPDVIDWEYSGNRYHPTEKSVAVLKPLISALCKPAGIVLDPFCGSGSTLVAAQQAGRSFLGIELDPSHCETAFRRTFRWEAA